MPLCLITGWKPVPPPVAAWGGQKDRPETKSAMDGTLRSCYHQDSAFVLPQQTGGAAGISLAQRVEAVTGGLGQFGRPRQDLQEQGVVGVAGADACGVGPRHQQRPGRGRRLGFGRHIGSRSSSRQSSTGPRIESASIDCQLARSPRRGGTLRNVQPII